MTTRNGYIPEGLYDFSIDRSTGAGRGWIFKFDATGKLLGKVELTDGTMFHPGGRIIEYFTSTTEALEREQELEAMFLNARSVEPVAS